MENYLYFLDIKSIKLLYFQLALQKFASNRAISLMHYGKILIIYTLNTRCGRGMRITR